MTERADDRRLTPSPGVTLERVAGEGILHDQAAGQVHVINESATRVWELCAGQPTAAELAMSLADTYGLPSEDVRADIDVIVEEFLAKGLLRFSAAHPD